jgi:hypothetical protein
MDGFIKYAVEKCFNAMIYVSDLIKIDSCIRKFIGGGGDTQTIMVIPYAYLYSFIISQVN